MSHKRAISRAGYTYVEILVVIAIIGILVALLLPAVQAAREAARRSRCSKNLEQLAIAMQCYEMQYQRFPTGTMNDTGPIRSIPLGYHHNWIVQILPFIEENNTNWHLDKRVSVYDPVHRPIRQMRLPTLSCYSAQNSARGYSDYAAVHNDFEAPIDADNHGSFYLNSHIRYDDLKDGSSQTLFIGEKFTFRGDLGWASGTRATLRNTGVLISPPRGPLPSGPPQTATENEDKDEPNISDDDLYRVLYGENGNLSPDGNLIQHRMVYPWLTTQRDSTGVGEIGPTDLYVNQSSGLPKDPQIVVGGFGSYHPGGSQFAFGDGSVRFVAQTIDRQIYTWLGNRDDGQLILLDW